MSESSEGPITAFLALGSNVEPRRDTLVQAVDQLAASDSLTIVSVSPIYETEPEGGPAGQRDFLNAAVHVETTLSAHELFQLTQSIETAHGRRRDVRGGPRTLDIDILTFGDMVSDEANLTLPHPRMHEREFVLLPLADIAPDRTHPRLGKAFLALLDDLPRPLRGRRLCELTRARDG